MEANAVLPAVFIRDGLLDLIAGFGDHLSGKLVIDISNPFNEDYSDFLTPWDTSGAEESSGMGLALVRRTWSERSRTSSGKYSTRPCSRKA